MWQQVLDGKQRPKGWINSADARVALRLRAEDFAGMSARYFKAQQAKQGGKGA